MARKSAPVLDIVIPDKVWETAKQASSGGCLIADSLKLQYPHLSGVRVDMATIRASDKAKGLRYTWLTPSAGQHLLLSYDQGWSQPTDHVKTGRPVKVTPITRQQSGPKSTATISERREQRRVDLESKLAAGETLTKSEKAALTRISKPYTPPLRPGTEGPPETVEVGHETVVVGGKPIKQGPAHPNLLRGRDRLFGAKSAKPAQAFEEAVDAAVEQRLAEIKDHT